jgi:hypothetical protein
MLFILSALGGILLGFVGVYFMERSIIERAISRGEDTRRYAPLFYRPKHVVRVGPLRESDDFIGFKQSPNKR